MPAPTIQPAGTLGARRQELGKDQFDIADECDTTQGTVSRWENGRQFPRDKETRALMVTAYACENIEELFELLGRTAAAHGGSEESGALLTPALLAAA